MNSKMKRRMVAVAGVIIIVVIVLLAVVGGNSNAKVVDVAGAASGDYASKKVQVTGTVVDNSYEISEDGVLTFWIQDESATSEEDPSICVVYDRGVSATFGNGVIAICTGRMGDDNILTCSELVTKCPSRYESATEALTVDQLLGYDGSVMVGKTVKVAGTVASLGPATQEVRFTLQGEAGQLSVIFAGALPAEVEDGASVVITGSLEDTSGRFLATMVSLEG